MGLDDFLRRASAEANRKMYDTAKSASRNRSLSDEQRERAKEIADKAKSNLNKLEDFKRNRGNY